MKNHTRFFALFISVLIFLCSLPFTAFAQERLEVVNATVLQEPYEKTCFSGAEEDTTGLSGLVIEFEFSDGSKEIWGYDYCSLPDLRGNTVSWDFVRGENNELIKDGGKVILEVNCGEVSIALEYTIIENPVESFELQMDPVVIYENYSEKFWDDTVGAYYYYYTFDTDDTITVHYKDGTTVTDDAKFFKDAYGWGVELFHTQDENPWEVGKENYLFAKYLGYVVEIPVEFLPVPVKSIEVTKLPDKCEYEEYYKPLWQGMEIDLNLKDGTTVSATVDEADLKYIRYPSDDYVFSVGDYEVTIKEWDGEYSLVCFDVEEPIEGLTFTAPREIVDMTVKQVSRTGEGTVVDVEYADGEKETFEFDVQGFDRAVQDRDVSGRIKTKHGYTEYFLYAEYSSGKNITGYNMYFLDREVFAPLDVIIPVPGYALVGDADSDGKISVKDATAIQKHLAGIITLSETQTVAANANDWDNLNIKDATLIQKYVAGREVIFPIGEPFEI